MPGKNGAPMQASRAARVSASGRCSSGSFSKATASGSPAQSALKSPLYHFSIIAYWYSVSAVYSPRSGLSGSSPLFIFGIAGGRAGGGVLGSTRVLGGMSHLDRKSRDGLASSDLSASLRSRASFRKSPPSP